MSLQHSPGASRRTSTTMCPRSESILDDTKSVKERDDSEQTTIEIHSIEVSWDGDNDPKNPRNFGIARKWVLTILCALNTINITFASSAPTAATAQVMAEFHVGQELTYLTTSLFLLGFVFGPIVWGPGSELLGRRPILIFSMTLYTLFILGQSLAKNMETLLITRFLSGFFSSSPLTNSGGVISDIWPVESRAPAMSLFSASVFLGPVLGPIIGGIFTQSPSLNWRWIYWVMFILGAATTALTAIVLPETYAPVLLLQKACRLRKDNPSEKITYYASHEKQDWSISGLISRTLFKPFQMLFREPILLLVTIYIALVYGILYAQFQAFPLIFSGVRHFTTLQTGLSFIAVGIGSTFGAVINNHLNRDYGSLVREWRGFPPAEARLTGAMIAGPGLVIGIFWMGWTGAYEAVPWYVPAIAAMLLGLSISLVFMSFLTYLVDTYMEHAASALAANTMIRSAVGASFPLFIVPMYTKMGIQWASTLFGLLGLLLAPSPFLFYKYGPQIRRRSTFAPGHDLHIADEIRREKEIVNTP